MGKLTKEVLSQVEIPAFESPLDGQIYTLTKGAVYVGSLRNMLLSGLMQSSPTAYAKVRAAEFDAIRKGDAVAMRAAFVTLIREVAVAIPQDGKPEHSLLRRGRHDLTDLIEVLDPETHAQYRAVKYAGAQDQGEGMQPKVDPVKRTEAMVLLAESAAKLLLVPGF